MSPETDTQPAAHAGSGGPVHAVPAVDPELGQLIEAIRRLTQHGVTLSEQLRQASGVNDTDFRALTHLHDTPGLTPSELAELLDRTPAAVSAVVDRLDQAGHLTRERDPADRRRILLHPTELPRQVAADTLAPFLDALSAEFAEDEPDDIAGLVDGLHRIVAVMQDHVRAHTR